MGQLNLLSMDVVKDPIQVEHMVEQHSAHSQKVCTQHNQRNTHSGRHLDRSKPLALALRFRLIVGRVSIWFISALLPDLESCATAAPFRLSCLRGGKICAGWTSCPSASQWLARIASLDPDTGEGNSFANRKLKNDVCHDVLLPAQSVFWLTDDAQVRALGASRQTLVLGGWVEPPPFLKSGGFPLTHSRRGHAL